MATPFVQGRLLHRKLSGQLRTECGHCGQPIELAIDSELNTRVLTAASRILVGGHRPVVSTPYVDFKRVKNRCIVDDF